MVIVDGVAESDGSGGSGAEFAPDGLFSLMQDALNEGISVEGAFDDDTGYPTRVLIGDRVDLTAREFIPIDRPEGCAA